jgi:uncharacterized protein (DUF1778 family)
MATKAPKKRRKPKQALRRFKLEVRLTEFEKKVFSEAADRQHQSLSVWMRHAGFRAARPRDLAVP